MGTETVQKIDKKFITTASEKELREALKATLEVIQAQAVELQQLKQTVLNLSNEIRILKGEKKSQTLETARLLRL